MVRPGSWERGRGWELLYELCAMCNYGMCGGRRAASVGERGGPRAVGGQMGRQGMLRADRQTVVEELQSCRVAELGARRLDEGVRRSMGWRARLWVLFSFANERRAHPTHPSLTVLDNVRSYIPARLCASGTHHGASLARAFVQVRLVRGPRECMSACSRCARPVGPRLFSQSSN